MWNQPSSVLMEIPPHTGARRRKAFTLIELMVVIGIVGILAAILVPAVSQVMRSTTLATSASNMRSLAAGAVSYLAYNKRTFWPYRAPGEKDGQKGVEWWFGLEPIESTMMPEGERYLLPDSGPLAGFVPGGIREDPSFAFAGTPFKPKFRNGYIGIGYNVLLGGGWMGFKEPARVFELDNPAQTVVFATSAQINTFQSPASPDNPMIEEFYGIDDRFKTVHFRYKGEAIVAFADGSVGFLPMDPSTQDDRDPEAQIGRFAPVGSDRYLR